MFILLYFSRSLTLSLNISYYYFLSYFLFLLLFNLFFHFSHQVLKFNKQNLNFRSPDIFPILIHSFPPSSRFSETKKEYSETKRSRNDSFSWLTGYQSRQQDQTCSRNSESQKVFLNLIFNVERCLKFQVQNLAKAVGSNSKRLAPILRTQKAQKVRAAALARPGTKTIKPFCHN